MIRSDKDTYLRVLTAFLEDEILTYENFENKSSDEIAKDILEELRIRQDATFNWDPKKTEVLKLSKTEFFGLKFYIFISSVTLLLRGLLFILGR